HKIRMAIATAITRNIKAVRAFGLTPLLRRDAPAWCRGASSCTSCSRPRSCGHPRACSARVCAVLRMPLARLFLVTALVSCGGAPKPRPLPVDPPAGGADIMKPPPPKEPSKRDLALEEVKRLTAIADKDPLLAPWTGPYGGVPPWDKLDIKGFGKAFETGLA